MALPNSPSPGMSMPRSFCCRTTSITAPRSCAWKACSSLASPAAHARFASIRCSARGRLPAWLVRMCVLLLLMALLLPASAAPAIQAEVGCVGVGPAAVTGGKVVCDQQRLGRTAVAISHRTLSPVGPPGGLMLFNVVNEKDPRIRITILRPSGIAAMTGPLHPKQQTVSLQRRIRLPCAKDRDRGAPHGTAHRVAGGGHPPPAPTDRSVQISRTTL